MRCFIRCCDFILFIFGHNKVHKVLYNLSLLLDSHAMITIVVLSLPVRILIPSHSRLEFDKTCIN